MSRIVGRRWCIIRRCGERLGEAARAAMGGIDAEGVGDRLGGGVARAGTILGTLGHGVFLPAAFSTHVNA